MYKIPSLVKIGTTVKINVQRIDSTSLPKTLFAELEKEPSAKVIDYKMTDGGGLGFVLMLKDGSIIWCFDYEVVGAYNREDISIDGSIEMIRNNEIDYRSSTYINKINQFSFSEPVIDEKNIFSILNPLNFLSWLLFSLKDVF